MSIVVWVRHPGENEYTSIPSMKSVVLEPAVKTNLGALAAKKIQEPLTQRVGIQPVLTMYAMSTKLRHRVNCLCETLKQQIG